MRRRGRGNGGEYGERVADEVSADHGAERKAEVENADEPGSI